MSLLGLNRPKVSLSGLKRAGLPLNEQNGVSAEPGHIAAVGIN